MTVSITTSAMPSTRSLPPSSRWPPTWCCGADNLDLLTVRPIPLVDVKAQYEPLLPRIREVIDGVLQRGEFILGPNVAAFEREAAGYLGVRDAVGVANG